LAVERAGVAGHVWSKPDLPTAKGKASAANPVYERNKREACGVHSLFERTVALAQYRGSSTLLRKGEVRYCPAN
jgi:hypothetical protein